MPFFLPKSKSDKPKVKLAVIIAARNEADNIGACISSVLKNDYPYFELIIIDDHSEDATLDKINSFSDSGLKCLSQKPGLSGKKKALEYGISATDAELIVTIDADCIVDASFVKVVVQKYIDTGFNAMAGAIKIKTENSIVSSFQQLDASGTMAVNAYGILKNQYYLSNGANFAFTRKSFNEVGGYKGNDHLASGDDLFLIQKIARLAKSKIVFLKAKEGIVLTQGQPTLDSLMVQRRRWASKSSAYQDNGLKILLAGIWLFHFFILLNLVLSFFLGINLFYLSMFMLLLKMLVDYIFLKGLSRDFETGSAFRHYVLTSLMSTMIVVYSGLIGIFPSTYVWKGRTLK